VKFNISKKQQFVLSAVFAVALTGCGSDSDENAGDGTGTDLQPAEGWSATVVTSNMDATDSSTIAVYDLSSASNTVTNLMEDVQGNWHFAYQKSRGFETNSGDNGEGNSGVEIQGCTAHTYSELYDEEGNVDLDKIETMTASSTLAQFEHLDFNACSDFKTDATATPNLIGSAWYELNGHSIAIPAGTKGWIIQSSDETYARITPKEYDNGLTFTVETWNGTSWDAAVDSPAIDYYSGSNAYYDFDTNTANATEVQGWDLYFKNTNHLPEIILSEDAGVGYYYDNSEEDAFEYVSVDQLDHPTSPTVGAALYKWYGNTTSGALTGPGYYGGLERKGYGYVANYTTYLVKEGNTHYKVQFLGYNGEDGEAGTGTLVIRYASKTIEE